MKESVGERDKAYLQEADVDCSAFNVVGIHGESVMDGVFPGAKSVVVVLPKLKSCGGAIGRRG